MATTESGEVGTAACPLCDDYRGPPSSVEAHISRMTDPVHQGEVGRAHRDELQRGVAASEDVETSDEQAVETSEEPSTEDPSGDGGPRSEDRDTADYDGPDVAEIDEGDVAASGMMAAGAGVPMALSAGDGEGGTSTWALVGLAVVAIVLLWYVTRDRGDDQEPTEQDQTEPVEQGRATGMTPPSGGFAGGR